MTPLNVVCDENLDSLHFFMSRIEANYKVWDFELSSEDMALFHDLNVGWRHLLWAETSGHQDYPFKSELPNGYVLGKPGAGSSAGAK